MKDKLITIAILGNLNEAIRIKDMLHLSGIE